MVECRNRFKLKHHDNLQIISLYGLGWPVNAIVKWLAEKVIDFTWDAVKKVIGAVAVNPAASIT
jgi:hypothetical protein